MPPQPSSPDGPLRPHGDPLTQSPLTQSPERIRMSRGISFAEDRVGELSQPEPSQRGSGGGGGGGTGLPPSPLGGSGAAPPPPPPLHEAAPPRTTGAGAHAAAVTACEDHQVGIIASGFAWVDRQREQRRRQYLQSEAEKQLQKIAEAELARRAAAAADRHRHGSHHHHHQPPSDHPSVDQQQQHHQKQQQHCQPHQGRHPNGGATTATSAEIREPWLRRDASDASAQSGEEVRIGKSDVSKSGEGASAQLDLSDVLGSDDGSVSDGETDGYCHHDDDDDGHVPDVRVDPASNDPASPFILGHDQMQAIACRVLPRTIAFCRWRRLYGLARDGDSFDGCLRIVGDAPRTLLVIRTSRGAVFGGYSDTPWMPPDHNNTRFYGSAAACLFSFSPDEACDGGEGPAAPTTPTEGGAAATSRLNVYRWTGKNRYIQLCDTSHRMLAFGGGGTDGAFGLCVQDDFTRGSTGPCDTFGNAPLCEPGSFDVVDVEFWEFLTGVF